MRQALPAIYNGLLSKLPFVDNIVRLYNGTFKALDKELWTGILDDMMKCSVVNFIAYFAYRIVRLFTGFGESKLKLLNFLFYSMVAVTTMIGAYFAMIFADYVRFRWPKQYTVIMLIAGIGLALLHILLLYFPLRAAMTFGRITRFVLSDIFFGALDGIAIWFFSAIVFLSLRRLVPEPDTILILFLFSICLLLYSFIKSKIKG